MAQCQRGYAGQGSFLALFSYGRVRRQMDMESADKFLCL